MKIRIIHYLINLCIFFGCHHIGFAQTATIDIRKLKDSNLKNELNCYWTDDNFEFFNRTPHRKNKALKHDSIFTIKFDKGIDHRYITLKTGNEKNADKILLLDFLIFLGDSVVISEEDDRLVFNGIGAEIMNLQYQLSRIEKTVSFPHYVNKKIDLVEKEPELSSILHDKLQSLLQYNYMKRDSQLIVLDRYINQIDKNSYRLLKLNIIGKNEQNLLTQLIMVFYRISKENPNLENEKSLFIQEYLRRNTRLHEVTNKNFFQANEMENYFMERMRLRKWLGTAFEKEWDYGMMKQESLDRIYYRYFFQNYSKMDDAQQAKILSNISCEKYIDAVQLFRVQTTQGQLLPDFKLMDTSGNLVQFSDLRGKIIVLDFWFTGCANCKVLHEEMKAVRKELGDVKDLCFVNISIDEDMEKWKKSVQSGSYSDSSDISLYTMGEKSLHPIIKFFNVISYPRQVILDKEMRIVTTQVPRPSSQEQATALVSLIKSIK
ncbi:MULTISPECIES: TlpA family protein disulfide reductase [unclassified Sphingobacterium]|uniref:TlpA family protein disulfide reductase n=1 Tax=unclassified Sphingobacterium TaxID=2609468 RepID=UPI00143B33B7|nr:TlpA disulfide reductase family protein [Sphingobacterium sp. B16(2022)]NJI74247.1 TlpA family protein disulfide reductase [Sphingobacterium sp. B16(2022)]